MKILAQRATLLLPLLSIHTLAGCGAGEFETSGLNAPSETPTGSDLEITSQPIVGGTATSARPEVGSLQTSAGGCTATLVGNRHILTAAHCIGYAPQFRGGTFTVNANTSTAQTFTIERAFSQGGQVGGDDLAIARLSSGVTVASPAGISSTQPSGGATLTVIGYGCSDRNTGTGGGTKRFKTYTNNGSTQNYCPGDSGGATFNGTLNGGGAIVRVTSGHSNFTSNDIGADPVTYRQHILSMISAMESAGVSYRAHVTGKGWLPATTNEAVAGTIGEGRRMEALQVWAPNPSVKVCYSAHVGGIGWMPEKCDGDMVGTTGQSRQIEAVKMRLQNPGPFSTVFYNVYLAGTGWQGWKANGQEAGTTGQNRRVEAIIVAFR